MTLSNEHNTTVAPEPDVPCTTGITLPAASMRRLRWYYGYHRSKHRAQFDETDLDLLRVGAINYRTGTYNDWAQVTRLGIQLIAEDRHRNRQNREPYNTLASRLAAHLRNTGRLTWENIEFKVAAGKLTRPDVFSLVATHSENRLCPTVHEVKISRADFLADISNNAKRDAYLKIANYVVYAAPDGIITPSEVPHPCGLIVESQDGRWKIVRRAKRNAISLNAWHFMNLILKPPLRNEL